MESSDPQSESDPAETSDESTDNQQHDEDSSQPGVSVSRRHALTGLAGLVGLGLLTGEARAQQGQQAKQWKIDVDADGNKLFNLHELEMIDGPVISSTDGTGLEVRLNGERALRFGPTPAAAAANILGGHPSNSVGSGVEGATVSGGGFDDGSTSQPNSVGADFGTVSGGRGNDASGEVSTVAGGRDNTVSADQASVGGGRNNRATGRQTTVGGGGGNEASGESAAIGGGRSNRALAAFATIAGGGPQNPSNPAATNNRVYNDYGTIGGGAENRVGTDDGDSTARHATVGGGLRNEATGTQATVGGGQNNNATGIDATVGGGQTNLATGNWATVGGGVLNEATGEFATIGGGAFNSATGQGTTIGGGISNNATGQSATVPGGSSNLASGAISFAAGRLAETETTGGTAHDGAFVYGDSSATTVRSQRDDQFVVQAGGGATIYSSSDLSTGVELPAGGGSWSSLSSRTAKTNVEAVDPETVLDAVEQLDVNTWEYKSGEEATHMGPIAEEFYDAFELGDSEKRIATVDADGVALAAIKGIADRLEEKEDRIETLETENELLRGQLDAVESRLSALETGSSSPVSADD